MSISKFIKAILPFVMTGSMAYAQESLDLDAAIQYALKYNLAIESSSLAVDHFEQLKKTSGEIPRTEISLMHGQYNSYVKNDNSISIMQTIPFPTVFTSQNGLAKARVLNSEIERQAIQNGIVSKVSNTFYQLLYIQAKMKLLWQQDSIFGELARAATLRYETGESNLLEKISAETQWNEVKNQLLQNEADEIIYQRQLQIELNAEQPVVVKGDIQDLLPFDKQSLNIDQNPTLKLAAQKEAIANYEKKVEAAKFLPDIRLGYFNQSLIGFQNVNGQEQYFGSSDRFQGFQIGLALPIWFVPNAAKVKAASFQRDRISKEFELYQITIRGELEKALKENEKAEKSLTYYKTHALPNADKLINQSDVAFKGGEIDYTTYLLNVKSAISIQSGYLSALRDFQLSVLTIHYLTGNLDLIKN